MGDKVRCRASFRDICNTTDKNDKKSVYFLFSTKRNRKRGRDLKLAAHGMVAVSW